HALFTTTFSSCYSPLFFVNDTPTPEISTLSLHDALPILEQPLGSLDAHLFHSASRFFSRSGRSGTNRSMHLLVVLQLLWQSLQLQLSARHHDAGSHPLAENQVIILAQGIELDSLLLKPCLSMS